MASGVQNDNNLIDSVLVAKRERIENLKRELDHLCKTRDEYNDLQANLKDLPTKTRQKSMVPIGSVAFFRADLVHTNEVTVFLGDGWFVERSAQQASEIAKRRTDGIDSRIGNIRKELGTAQDHAGKLGQYRQIQELAGNQFGGNADGIPKTGFTKDGTLEIYEPLEEEQKSKQEIGIKKPILKAHSKKPKTRHIPEKKQESVDDLLRRINEMNFGSDDDEPKMEIDNKKASTRLDEIKKEIREERKELPLEGDENKEKKTNEDAFMAGIVEKFDGDDTAMDTSATPDQTTSTAEKPAKKVSKFKQRMMK